MQRNKCISSKSLWTGEEFYAKDCRCSHFIKSFVKSVQKGELGKGLVISVLNSNILNKKPKSIYIPFASVALI